MTEPVLVMKWLKPIFLGDSILADPDSGVIGGWHFIAPPNARSPYGIVDQTTSAEDQFVLDDEERAGTPIWVPVIIQITLYDRVRGDYTQIDPLAQRVYQLLQRASGEPSGGIIYAAHRKRIKGRPENIGKDGVEYSIMQEFEFLAQSDGSE